MRAVGRNPYSLLLGVCLAGAAVALVLQRPFAFYSPDVSYHAARLLRASVGDYWTDPFAGTQSLYPHLFHAVFGTTNRVLGWTAFDMVRLIEVVNLLGIFLGFLVLARAVLPGRILPSLATLALSLVLFAPTGRYVLVANPANFSLIFVFFGAGFLWRYLSSDRLSDWTIGMFLAGVGVNVAWHLGAAVTGIVAVVLGCLRQEGRLRARVVGLGVLAAAVPCLWTAGHLWAVRDVLPDYFRPQDPLVTWNGGPGVLWDAAVTYVTRWNLKFLPQMRRSLPATLHYVVLVLPFCCGVLALALALHVRDLRRPGRPLGRRVRGLSATALAVFVLALPIAMTGDLARLAWVQFVSLAFLLLFVLSALAPTEDRRQTRVGYGLVAAAGVLSLLYTVLHAPGAPDLFLPRPTQGVVDFIRALPDARNTRIFVSEQSLRHLTPFVCFLSFVNHRHGRYANQDPVSADRMFAAYQLILARDPWADHALRSYGVEIMAFRHGAGGLESELAAAYAARGTVVLKNREWTVLRLR